jgi:hypothetical protein
MAAAKAQIILLCAAAVATRGNAKDAPNGGYFASVDAHC